jgi:hypothetical protein
MAFSAVAFIAPNYRDFKNYWLKAYNPGTTTPKVMALDNNGTVQVAKLQLNANGFIVSAGQALVVPYIDGPYDLWLFPTSTEADANNTSSAKRVADNIEAIGSAIINDLSQACIFDTVALFKASTIVFPVGKTIHLNDRGADFELVTYNAAANGYDEIKNTASTQSIGLVANGVISAKSCGAVGDNATDSTGAAQAALALAKTLGTIVYFKGGDYLINGTLNTTGTGMFGDGRALTILKTSGSPAVLHEGGLSSDRKFTSISHLQLLNNGGAGNGIQMSDSPRHNYLTDLKIYGYGGGAGIEIGNDFWITDYSDVFIDNCKFGLFFNPTQTIGNLGGSHTFRGGAIEGGQRAVEGLFKNLSFIGTVIEGNSGIVESFSGTDKVGCITLMGIGVGPLSLRDCWVESFPESAANPTGGLPAIITGEGATSNLTSSSSVLVSGGRCMSTRMFWIRGHTKTITMSDLDFGWASSNRHALIYNDNRNCSVQISNIRFNRIYQSIFDSFTYAYLPNTHMIWNGKMVMWREGAGDTGLILASNDPKLIRIDISTQNWLMEDFTQGGTARTY